MIRSLAKVIKIYPFVGNEVRNCRYQQSNSISDQIAVCDWKKFVKRLDNDYLNEIKSQKLLIKLASEI